MLRSLYKFPEVVSGASAELKPNLISNYIFDLAQRFNSFYADSPVINAEDENTKEFRLLLTYCVSVVLERGLWLLGIKAPEKM